MNTNQEEKSQERVPPLFAEFLKFFAAFAVIIAGALVALVAVQGMAR